MSSAGQHLQLAPYGSGAVVHSGPLLQDGSNVSIQGGTFYNVQGNAAFNLSHTHVYNTTISPPKQRSDAEDGPLGLLQEYGSNLFREIYRDIVERMTPGTGTIFVTSQEVQDWMEGHNSPLLWARGEPGAGKTYLLTFLITTLEFLSEDQPDVVVSFALLRYTERHLTTWDILMALLIQLVESKPLQSVMDIVTKTFERYRRRNTRPSLPDLVKTLKEMVKQYSRCYMLFDGLDEMPPQVQSKLLEIVPTLGANVVIMSRHMKLVEEGLDGLTPPVVFVDVRAEPEDLALFIDHFLNQTPSLKKLVDSHGIRHEVVSKIVQRADGMFIHASLQVEKLRDCLHPQDLWEELERNPPSTHELYAGTMARIQQQPIHHFQLATRVLLWVTHAQVGLSMAGLQHAVTASPGTYMVQPSAVVSADSILILCHGLVLLENETQHVRLSHYTTYEFLREYLATAYPNPHEPIAMTCLTRLASCGFQDSSMKTWGQYRAAFAVHPLLEYSQLHTTYHIHEAAKLSPTILDLVAQFVKGCVSYPYYFKKTGGHDSIEDATLLHILTPLHVACLFNLPSLVRHFVEEQGADVNLRARRSTEDGWTCLLIASREGHAVVVSTLLSFPEVEPGLADERGWTPLAIAAVYDRETVLKELLAVPGDVNPIDFIGFTPLMWACQAGHPRAVDALINIPGLEINRQSFQGMTPLSIASHTGRTSIVKMLLEKPGIDVNILNEDGQTAFTLAVEEGHEDVVSLLLGHPGIDVVTRTDAGLSALMLAARKGNVGMLKLLLAAPAASTSDVNQQAPETSWSALSWAIYSRQPQALECLLSVPGIEVNQVDDDKLTPLLMALNQDEGMAMMLLDVSGIELRPVPEVTSPLIQAAWYGYESAVQRLLKMPGVQVNYTNQHGWTAAMFAAYYGHLAVVKQIFAHPDHHLDLKTAQGDTILHLALSYNLKIYHSEDDGAEKNNYVDVVNFLLDRPEIRALVNVQNHRNYTPLMLAAMIGSETVVQRLLKIPGIDDGLEDEDGLMAFELAEIYEHQAVIDLLNPFKRIGRRLKKLFLPG